MTQTKDSHSVTLIFATNFPFSTVSLATKKKHHGSKPLVDSLSERLSKDANIFDNLLKLIPVKIYVIDKGDQADDSKFQYKKRKKTPKQAIKEATKKVKKTKLEPENLKTIMDFQEEKA